MCALSEKFNAWNTRTALFSPSTSTLPTPNTDGLVEITSTSKEPPRRCQDMALHKGAFHVPVLTGFVPRLAAAQFRLLS
jgi:hypothetical protein